MLCSTWKRNKKCCSFYLALPILLRSFFSLCCLAFFLSFARMPAAWLHNTKWWQPQRPKRTESQKENLRRIRIRKTWKYLDWRQDAHTLYHQQHIILSGIEYSSKKEEKNGSTSTLCGRTEIERVWMNRLSTCTGAVCKNIYENLYIIKV